MNDKENELNIVLMKHLINHVRNLSINLCKKLH